MYRLKEITANFQVIAPCHRKGLNVVSRLTAGPVTHPQLSHSGPSASKTLLQAAALMQKAIRQLMLLRNMAKHLS